MSLVSENAANPHGNFRAFNLLLKATTFSCLNINSMM